MSEPTEGLGRTLRVALAVSAVCSIAVSLVSVSLREEQQANVENDKRQKILAAARRTPGDGDIEAAFARVQVRHVELSSGLLIPAGDVTDARTALSEAEDVALIRTREDYASVYFFGTAERFEVLVLPVRGFGLWSTLYGYLALDKSLRRIVGLEFYEHRETAGLGGEVDNPGWKALWRGKELYDEKGGLAIRVDKGRVPLGVADAANRVDGLAGATMTGRGVTNLLDFWLGDNGFGPLLRRLRDQGGDDAG